MNPAAAAFLLELAADIAVHQRVENEPRSPLDIVEHPVEMALGSDHGPEMAQRLDPVELGKARLCNDFQRLTRGIREEVEVELAHQESACGKAWGKR
jgi:hypothetical protein